MTVRQPAVAGIFYPGDQLTLRNTIQHLLSQSKQYSPSPKVLVVPHAGYIYSGSIAASAYASLTQQNDTIKKIVLLGPAHTMYLKGIAYDPVKRFATPLGELEQDQDLLAKISTLPYVHALSQAHQREHCLEVQLPFCQMIFNEFTVLPLVVGETSEQEVADLIKQVWGGEETLIIISSDLSHYLPYDIAQQTDRNTCLSISTLNSEALHHQGACGYYPLRGFLHFARQNQICGRLLDLRNSGDTAGTKDKVVGYASYHFYQDLKFADHCADELLYLAKETLKLQATEKKLLIFNPMEYNELLHIRMPSFVTIKKKGMLRGCMGSLYSQELLADNVINNSIRAGFFDPRFPKLTSEELNDLSLSISILSPMETLYFNTEHELQSQLRQGVDGLLLTYKHYQATFLPSVWESIDSKDKFLEHLKLKMGLPANFWSAEMKAQRYTTEIIK
ncbi:AmmeMemoRadiSam system protein B [Legionella bononiensis]|uniref:MEMO1 family protein I5282_09795 n=1 Tax=Legionella bononiensis TaxID=2793102 RepID=A0ABS1WBX9_9GAMM|nr:AmmeMemoRadiSam system protein B [Legionella bononiensis]MBL7481153.1 AmmeMemoRadiSam system protein B [Legionella bononiensis]MBL7526862.1 AmmeMemoRadiSam system protein B [Legionella bononiensis]MBL7564269.1 AmmeMemoRadiSam system protein B [Legionella bononiensis]